MRKTLTSFIIAGMVVSATPNVIPVNVVSAASVQNDLTISKQSFYIDGIKKSIPTIIVNGKSLVSAKEVAKQMKAKYIYDAKTKTYQLMAGKKQITFKVNSKTLISNKQKLTLTAPITTYKKQVFLELEPVVKGLGGDLLTKEKFIATKGLVSGNSLNMKWVDTNHIVFTNEQDEKMSTYLLNVQTKQVEKVFTTTDIAISNDGKKAIYTDENQEVYLIDLQTRKRKLLTNDDSFKTEFIWSKDGSKVFFLQGDKSETISSISTNDGSITKIVDDKVEYKADLRLTADGAKFLYTAAKQAVTKYTDDEKTDVDMIDTEGTEPQLFVFDITESKGVPVAITNTKKNKFFIQSLPSGEVLYLEEDPENESAFPVLKVSSIDGKLVKEWVKTKQIDAVTTSVSGLIYMASTESNGTSNIYQISPTGKLKHVLSTKLNITSLEVSSDGKQLVGMVSTDKGDKLVLIKNGLILDLTKN